MWWIKSHWPKLVDGTFYQVDSMFLSAMNRPSSCQIFSVDVHKCQKSTNTNSTRFPYRSVATLLQFAFTLPCFETSWSFQTYLDIWANIQTSWSKIAILTLVVACRGTYYSHAQHMPLQFHQLLLKSKLFNSITNALTLMRPTSLRFPNI